MSGSELSIQDDIPADREIEQCLRRIVREHKKKTDDPLSVNQVRDIAAKELDFDVSILKGTEWKARSKDIITDAFNEDGEPSPEKPKAKPTKAAPKPKAKAGTKRKSDDKEPKKTQRRKKAKVESEDDLSETEAEDDEEFDARPAKKPAKKRATKKAAAKVESEIEDNEDEPAKDDAEQAVEDAVECKKEPLAKADNGESELSDVPDKLEVPEASGKTSAAEDNGSELSSVIDEPPRKQRAKKAACETKPKPKATGKTKSKAAGKELSPDEEEIKRLQGWLVKCGIRKLWHRELVKCETPKEKIKHLKKMLDEIGMTPRYSNEKAKQIKETRELAAELAAAKEFNERWGQSEGEEDDEGGEEGKTASDSEEKKDGEAPKRRLPKGFVDFGDSGDEASD